MATTKTSRTKGANYERKIASLLSKEFGTEFKKCPGSGAIGTLSGIEGLQGDIIRADLKPIPYIECKKYKDFRIENFLLKQGDEWKWVQQTLGNIKNSRVWCIIFQKNYGRHHWLLTNTPILISSSGKGAPQFQLHLSYDGIWTLTTLNIAFTDPNFRSLFHNE